ncbi:MAG: PspC domain-containing protein [Gaiellaceae bacterium MAG52_C11]|nr:PspC domain-containing protein [Candidatus Gaiellasilicea maunaloa]
MSDTITENTPVDEAPPRRLVRIADGRWLGGVCAGLGRYFDVNPLVYRIAFAALSLAGGTGLLLYLAAWLVMPSETGDDSIAAEALREHRDRPWLLLGVGLLSFGAILALSEARFWPGTGNVWLAALLVGAAIVWWHVGNRSDRPRTTSPESTTVPAPPPQPTRPSLLFPVLGALLAAAGLLGLLAVLDVYEVDVAVALAAGVAIVGAAVAVGATTGRRVGALVLLGLALLAGFGVAAATPVSFSSGVGDRTERPLAVTDLEESYELGAGSFSVDLSSVELPSGTTEVDVKLGLGEVVITVPDGVALEVDARAGIGEVNVLGDRDEGAGADERIAVAGSTPDAPVLKLDADVGFGYLEVRRG